MGPGSSHSDALHNAASLIFLPFLQKVEPLLNTVGSALDAMSKDPQALSKATVNAREALGRAIVQGNEYYNQLADREKGHVIGHAAFALVNPEGSTKSGEAALKIADTVATHVDAVVIKTIDQSLEAIKKAPELAADIKKGLYDFVKGKGLTAQELEAAGIRHGFFDEVAEAPNATDSALKMLGRAGEYVPEDKPMFLAPGKNKVLNEREIEAFGGMDKLEKMSDGELASIGLRRFEMPKLRLESDEFSLQAKVAGDERAWFRATMLEDKTLVLTDLNKGAMPDGTGGHFLAEALKAHKVRPTGKIIFKNVIEKETLPALEAGVRPEQTKIGRCVIKGLKELGVTPTAFQIIKTDRGIDIVLEVE